MRVLFWIPYPTEGASNRYRIEQYLPYLKKAGIEYTLRPFWNTAAFKVLYKNGYCLKKIYFFILGTIFRFLDLVQISKYDIVFIHREAYPLYGVSFETILWILRKPLIFDFDDAIFLSNSSRPNSFIEKFKNPNRVAKIIKMSNYIIAGNRYLADFALRYNPNVAIIPTPIDTDRFYPANNKKHDGKITIGWIGSVTTVDFLNTLKNAFIELLKDSNNITLKIVGGNFYIKNIPNIISKQWSLDEEIEDVRSFDIGIMPMPENEWTICKCGLKAILYMSMGIPCVCSSVGVNKEIIIEGVNGFLADTQDEWVRKLSLLIQDSQLRQRIGLGGRKTVEERYSVRVNAPKVLGIIQRVYNEHYRQGSI